MTWVSELRRLINARWPIGAEFTLEDVYEFEPHFAEIYPKNRHLGARLRKTLQELRDGGEIEFVDYHGTYRRRH